MSIEAQPLDYSELRCDLSYGALQRLEQILAAATIIPKGQNTQIWAELKNLGNVVTNLLQRVPPARSEVQCPDGCKPESAREMGDDTNWME